MLKKVQMLESNRPFFLDIAYVIVNQSSQPFVSFVITNFTVQQ